MTDTLVMDDWHIAQSFVDQLTQRATGVAPALGSLAKICPHGTPNCQAPPNFGLVVHARARAQERERAHRRRRHTGQAAVAVHRGSVQQSGGGQRRRRNVSRRGLFCRFCLCSSNVRRETMLAPQGPAVPQQRGSLVGRSRVRPLARFRMGSWDRFDELARAANKFLRCSRYQGGHPKNFNFGPSGRLFPSYLRAALPVAC